MRISGLSGDEAYLVVRYEYTPGLDELDSVEQVIASEEGVTADDLFEFARDAGRDPARMGRLWEDIRQRVDSLRPPDEEEERTDQAPARGGARRVGSEP